MNQGNETVWSSAAFSLASIWPIGTEFPGLLDFRDYYLVDCLEIDGRYLEPKEHDQLQALRRVDLQLWQDYRDCKRLSTQPDSLWPTDRRFPPAGEDGLFRIRNSGLVLNSQTAEILQQFRLGETVLTPVRMMKLANGEPWNDHPYYFLNLCAWREYAALEAGAALLSEIGYQRNGYPLYQTVDGKGYPLKREALASDLDLWHEPNYPGSILLSQALVNALNDAGLDSPWQLSPCHLL